MLPAPMPPSADWPLFTTVLGVAVEECPVEDSSLLGVCHAWGFAVVGVCEHVPDVACKPECGHIGACGVCGVVLCFTLGKRPVFRIWEWVVPCDWRGWYRDAQYERREYLQNSSPSLPFQ
jgi:hypothetical protein